MVQQTAIKPYNTFVKGIVTEAGPLTYPENASIDEENFVLNRDGSRQRRLGMDLEQDFVLVPVTATATTSVVSYEWTNVANDPSRTFSVVQVGVMLYVFNARPVSTSQSLIGVLDMTTYVDGLKPITFSNGLGFLLGGCEGSDPFYVEFNPATSALSITRLVLLVRDFFGVPDGLAVNERPASLSAQHDYNLHNQGWPSALIGNYKTASGFYPSNAQQWPLGKDTNDDFTPSLLDKQDFGTTPAPKGRYIISPFDRSIYRDAMSSIATPTDRDFTRPSTVAFAFQRAFYAGAQSIPPLPLASSPNLTGFVFYSRTVQNQGDLVKCYQEADPTSEVDSELVDTDGGYITIPDSGRIYRLVAKGATMIVLAENGVWAITGDDGGFRATAQQVVKVSDFGVLGAAAVVDVEDAILYWNKGGVYLLTLDQGLPQAVNITENSIQTLFNAIPNVAKSGAVGSFDPVNRQVRWMYSSDPNYDGVNFRNKYDSELILDMVLQAWYKNSISEIGTPSPYIAGYSRMPDPLLPKEGVRNRGTTITKYLVIQFVDEGANAAAISFAFYRDETFRDWKAIDGLGASFTSYMISGYELMGDTMRNKRVDYISCHFKMTERNSVATEDGVTADNPSGCLVQAQWDWSNHPDSGKWGEAFQAYRLLRPFILPAAGEPINYGYEVVTTKSRLPGSGKALSLLFKSDEDKDCYLYGWSIKVSGVSSV